MLSFPLLNRPEDACGSPQWFNDTYCDDDNNNEECGWDGGDCCGDDIKTGKFFPKKMSCLFIVYFFLKFVYIFDRLLQ